MLTNEYPTPAVGAEVTKDSADSPIRSLSPGTLPDAAVDLSKPARGLLLRLLDKDPKCRLRNLRQLQQTAFYMGTDFEQIKKKKVTPRSIYERYFTADIQDDVDMSSCTNFQDF